MFDNTDKNISENKLHNPLKLSFTPICLVCVLQINIFVSSMISKYKTNNREGVLQRTLVLIL